MFFTWLRHAAQYLNMVIASDQFVREFSEEDRQTIRNAFNTIKRRVG